MKILVTVKRVIDYNVQVRVKSDGSGVETENIHTFSKIWSKYLHSGNPVY